MSDQPTPEPIGRVRPSAGGPRSDADTTAAFTDIVCADHDLLRAEFDAIITANFPGHHALDRPERSGPTDTGRIAAGGVVPGRDLAPHHVGPGRVNGVTLRRQARQRGPPPGPSRTAPTRSDRR